MMVAARPGEAKTMAKTAAKKPANKPAKKTAKKPAPKPTKAAAKKPAKDLAKKPMKSTAQKSTKAPAKTAPKARAKPAAKKKLLFKPGDFVVYPTHGVGKVTSVEIQEIVGHKLKLFVISFETERMTLRVPDSKATPSGLR